MPKGYITFLQFSSCFGGILSLILIVCGVGLLRERSWGRTGSLGYAAFQLLFTLAGTAPVHVHDETRRIVYLQRGWRDVRRALRIDLPDLHHDLPDPPECR